MNGTVHNCAQGVVLDGDGKHQVRGVTARDSLGSTPLNDADGFNVPSDGNKLSKNVSVENDDGFDIRLDGNANKLDKNLAAGNAEFGFRKNGFLISNADGTPQPPCIE